MKIFLTVLSVLLISVQIFSIDKTEISNIAEECEKATNVPKDMTDKAKSGEEIVDNPLMKQHLSCYYKGLQILDPKSKIAKEKLEEYLKIQLKGKSEDKIKKVVEDCNKVKDTPEETAFEMAKCITKFKKM